MYVIPRRLFRSMYLKLQLLDMNANYDRNEPIVLVRTPEQLEKVLHTFRCDSAEYSPGNQHPDWREGSWLRWYP